MLKSGFEQCPSVPIATSSRRDDVCRGMLGIAEERVRPRAIGDCKIAVVCHEVDLFVVKIIPVCDHHAFQVGQGTQVIERPQSWRKDSRPPGPQAGQQLDKFPLSLAEQLQFGLCFGQMNGKGGPLLLSQSDDPLEQCRMHGIRRVRADPASGRSGASGSST